VDSVHVAVLGRRVRAAAPLLTDLFEGWLTPSRSLSPPRCPPARTGAAPVPVNSVHIDEVSARVRFVAPPLPDQIEVVSAPARSLAPPRSPPARTGAVPVPVRSVAPARAEPLDEVSVRGRLRAAPPPDQLDALSTPALPS